MDRKNPFELKPRNEGPATAALTRAWTPAERAEKLHGYMEIAPEFWEHIRYGTHMRYITKTGEFRTGGFVLKNPSISVSDTGDEARASRSMRLQNGFSDKARGYAQWSVAYDDTERIYIKPDAGVLMTMQSLEIAVKGLNENIRKTLEYVKKIDARTKL